MAWLFTFHTNKHINKQTDKQNNKQEIIYNSVTLDKPMDKNIVIISKNYAAII